MTFKQSFKIVILVLSFLFITNCKKDDTPITPTTPSVPTQDNYTPTNAVIKNYGGTKNESANAIVKTADGGYAVLGHTQSSDGDITDKTGTSFDYWLLKFTQNHDLQWSKTYGGSQDDRGYDITTTQDGGFVLAGFSTSNDEDVSNNNGDLDFWITKINALGNIVWENSYGFIGADFAHSIIETQDNGFLVVGVLDVTASGGAGNSKNMNFEHAGGDYWVIKLDANGTQQWTKYFGGNLSDSPFGIIELDNGNFVIAGDSDSTDTDISSPIGVEDYWVICISSTGTLIWENNFGGTQIDQAKGIIKTTDGNIMVVGTSRSDDVDITNNYGGADIWLAKLNTNGNLLWEKNYGGSNFDNGTNISKSTNGYIITGLSRSATQDFNSNNGQNDGVLIHIGESGTVNWTRNFGGSDEDKINDAVQLSNGTIIAVGETSSSDFDLSENKGFTDLLKIILE